MADNQDFLGKLGRYATLLERKVGHEKQALDALHGNHEMRASISRTLYGYETCLTELYLIFPEMKPVSDFKDELTIRARNCLDNANVRRLCDLVGYTKEGFRESSKRKQGHYIGGGADNTTLGVIEKVLLEPFGFNFKMNKQGDTTR